MFEDSSSDEEWCPPFKKAKKATKCWECGKYFRDQELLIGHYRMHSVNATCHICKITFQRQTSLSAHLDNVHSPSICPKCLLCFINSEELNKHAESNCKGQCLQDAPSINLETPCSSQHKAGTSNAVLLQNDMEKPVETENFESSFEYLVGEDDSSFKTDDFEDSVDADEEESCSNSENSSDEHIKIVSHTRNNVKLSTITEKRSRPQENYERHHRSWKTPLFRCKKIKQYYCKVCKKKFQSEQSHNEHLRALYTCKLCYQVFFTKNLYSFHKCSNNNNLPCITMFCYNCMPKQCKICRAFFAQGKALQKHIIHTHKSVTKKGTNLPKTSIKTNSSPILKKPVAPPNTQVKECTSVAFDQQPKLCLSNPNKTGPSPTVLPVLNTSCREEAHSSERHTHLSPISKKHPAHVDTQEKEDMLGPPEKQLQSEETAPSPPMPTVLAMFENESRMNTNWRSKACYPCRHCGAISRQLSLVISHRYLHRGRRSHLCQCGRAFKHLLHLLRHRVQHAEATGYICVSCGETFNGSKQLARHLKCKYHATRHFTEHTYSKAKQKCAMPFICDCGQLFCKPSALIWHQLKNKSK